MKAQLVFIIMIFISSSSVALSVVPECRGRPDFLARGKVITSLPRMAFVAKSANFYVESKDLKTRIWGTQNFLNGQSQILCGATGSSDAQSFSIYAPTLIDGTGEKHLATSYWQFHMMTNSKQFGIWNQKSRLFPKTRDLEEGLLKIGTQTQIIQISHDEYEIHMTREHDSRVEVISIRFDALPKLP